MRVALLALFTAGMPFGACHLFPRDRACTTLYAYGVSVTLTSAATGQPISNATLTLTEGSYTEQMQAFPTGAGQYAGAGERPGTYVLQVTADGYEPKTIPDIVVGSDECHVIGVPLNVQLTPVTQQ